MNYVKKIKIEAKKRNVSMNHLAKALHISEAEMKKRLKENNLSVSQLELICSELNINVQDLFRAESPSLNIKMENSLRFLNNKAFC